MQVLKAGLIQLSWALGGWNRSGGWVIILSNLIIRDLKVSNLLMTDKGCVKIGESPPSRAAVPAVQHALQHLCHNLTSAHSLLTFSHMVHVRLESCENTQVSTGNSCHLCRLCWRDCYCLQLILGWPGCTGFHSSPWLPEWSHYGERKLVLMDVCSRYVEYLILHSDHSDVFLQI